MWARKLRRGLDYTQNTQRKRLGSRLFFFLAVLAVIPGLVAGTAYISATSSQTLSSTNTAVTAVSCGFYDPINNTAVPYDTPTGTNGTSLTVNFGTVDSATYEYLVDEVAVGCTGIQANSYVGLHVFQSSHTVSNSKYDDVFVSGGATSGIGHWTTAGVLGCVGGVVTGAPCNNYPDKPYLNPTTGTACETGAPTTTTLYRPFGATNVNTWAFNDTAGAWATAGCGAASGLPPQINITMTSTVSTDVYFFYVISVGEYGNNASPVGAVTLKMDFCSGGAVTCTASG